jgi:hypothetical protein
MKETKFRKIFFNYFTIESIQLWDNKTTFTNRHIKIINEAIEKQLDQFIEKLAYSYNLIEPLESIDGLSGEEEAKAIKALKANPYKQYKQEEEKIQ